MQHFVYGGRFFTALRSVQNDGSNNGIILNDGFIEGPAIEDVLQSLQRSRHPEQREGSVNTTATIVLCSTLFMGTDSSLRYASFRMTVPIMALFYELETR